MVIAVRTERGPDGLEVVKEADSDEDRVRLADEAAVLRRAAHPGVVEVVEASDSVLRLRHCGSPLSRLGPVAPDHAAAIVRAVAETVDALHRQRIVHRRLDADHVVVSERGRPHLVGFGAAGDGDADEIADDVAALGALLEHLLDAGADALWSTPHRGVRAATRRKRAMSAFRTAAASAQRHDAAQRPSAHQFATAISEALPGLTLPTPPGLDPSRGDAPGSAELRQSVDPTTDVGWTDFDLSFLAVDDDVVDPHDAVERNPAAPRDPYAVLESLASPEPGTGSAPVPEPAPMGPGSAEDPHDDPQPTSDEEPDPIIAALRKAIESESEAQTGTEERSAAAVETGDDVVPDPPHPPRPPSIQIREGRADPRPGEGRGGSSRRALVAVAIVVLVVGAVAGSVIARAIDPFGADTATAGDGASSQDRASAGDRAPADETPTSSTTDDAPRTPPPISEGCAPVAVAGPDGDADGCPDPVALDGRVATVGDTAVEVGRDGDLVVVADADCDGTATPVVLRPETGEVFVFPGWSLDEAIEVPASRVVDGAVSIETDDGACPDVVVTDDAGDQVVVAP